MSKEINKKIKDLAEKYDLSLVLLFGSQVTGNTHSESDFDVAYVSNKKLTFDDEVKFNTSLTDVFRNDKVSLVNLKTASPLLAKQIVMNCKIFYEKKGHLFSDLLTYTLRTYEEASPLFDLRRHYLNYKMNQYKHA